MKNFNEELVELKKLRKELINNENTLNEKKLNEVKDAVNLIQEKYDPKIKKINLDISQTEDNIKKLNENIVKYSTFDTRDMVEIMTDIIRIYEGEQFILDEVYYHPNPKRIIIAEKALLLANKAKQKFLRNKDCYKERIYSIQKHGDGIVLNWKVESENRNYIKFYDFNHVDELMTNIKLNKFPYLKQFIDFVILHRMSNNIKKDLPIGKLEKLKYEFIKDNIENIRKYHEMVKFNEENEMKKEINKNAEYRNKQLRKALKK